MLNYKTLDVPRLSPSLLSLEQKDDVRQMMFLPPTPQRPKMQWQVTELTTPRTAFNINQAPRPEQPKRLFGPTEDFDDDKD